MWDPEGASVYLVLPAPGIPHEEITGGRMCRGQERAFWGWWPVRLQTSNLASSVSSSVDINESRMDFKDQES